jgi:hypothetical protein
MRTELKLVGFFRETHPFLIRGQRKTLPSFHEYVSDNPQQEAESKIIGYLESGKDAGYLSSRPICKRPEDRLTFDRSGVVLTDGVWAWPSELAYYVEAFHLRLPPEFISHMGSNEWKPPSDVDVENLAFPGAV